MIFSNRQRYACFGLVLLVALAWSGFLDAMARDFATDGIIQAGAFYGTIRLLNGTISMFQEVQINFLISNLAIGQLLDPVNDLVEYVSEGLKFALGSYLLQRVIIEVVSTKLFNIIFTVAGVVYAASFFAFSHGIKTLAFKLFVTLAFLRFSIILLMLATTAFSSSFLDDKIEEERLKTQRLSSELNDTRKAATDVSDELAEVIHADIKALETKKSDLISEVQPLREEIRAIRYAISKKRKAVAEIKDEIGVVKSWKGNKEIDELELQVEASETRISVLQGEVEALNDEIAFLEREINLAEEHLFEESSGFVKTLMQDVGSAWDYISALAEGLTNSTMSALVLFIFKMLLLPILFLYILLKLFKYVWGLELTEAGNNIRSEVNSTLGRNLDQ